MCSSDLATTAKPRPCSPARAAEYKTAIYVLQNLQAYGKGNGTTVPATDGGVRSKA